MNDNIRKGKKQLMLNSSKSRQMNIFLYWQWPDNLSPRHKLPRVQRRHPRGLLQSSGQSGGGTGCSGWALKLAGQQAIKQITLGGASYNLFGEQERW